MTRPAWTKPWRRVWPQRLPAAAAPGSFSLGAGEVGQALPPVFVWWRGFAARYVAGLCLHEPGTQTGVLPDIPAPTEADLASLVLTAPMMTGAEYLTPDVLRGLWTAMVVLRRR